MNHSFFFRTTVTVLFMALITNSLTAQEKKTLTLQAAIDLGIQYSKHLKFNIARIDQAVAAVQEAKERRLPDAEISGSYLRVNSPNISMKNKTSGSGGGTSGDEKVSVSQLVYGMANISLPIYSGSKIRYGIESAQFLEKAVRLDAEHDKEAVIMNIVDAYVNLYKSNKAVSLMKENLQSSRSRDKDLANLENNGLLARNDLLKAKLQTSNYELALLDAENNYKLASVNMNILLGLPENMLTEADSTAFEVPLPLKSEIELEQLALQNRKDIQALQQRQHVADLNTKSVHADYYPSLGLTAGYVAADIPGFLSVTNAINAGIGVKYSLSSLWKAKSKIQQAEAQERQLLSQEELLNDQIKIGVNKSYQDVVLSGKKIDVYSNAIDQATENFRITKNKFDNNLVTTTDLLDADVALLQARLNHAFAKADALAAWEKLQQVTGTLHSATVKNN